MISLPDEKLMNQLKLYGSHTIAYSSVIDDTLTTFWHKDKGAIRYETFNNFRFMLGDPLCDEKDLNKVIVKFISDCKKNDKNLIAVQCSQKTANIFVKYGYFANQFGIETILNVPEFSTKGKEKTKVRRWINSATSANLTVLEKNMNDSSLIKDIKELSDNWLTTKANTKELHCLTRPLILKFEPETRLFCAYSQSRLEGFILFEPIFNQGKPIGYYANICRTAIESPNGTLDLIIATAIEEFKKEDIKIFSFGLSPLTEIEDEGNYHNQIVKMFLKMSYQYGEKMYSFKGLDFHKKAYYDPKDSTRIHAYLITKGTLSVINLLTILEYIGIIPNKNKISDLKFYSEKVLGGFLGAQKEKIKINRENLSEILGYFEISKESTANLFSKINEKMEILSNNVLSHSVKTDDDFGTKWFDVLKR